jgi:beta-phosphoglucomutase-like phosphatase (HAD superfamily)
MIRNDNGPKAFIFDMDGVLVDNMRMHAQSWVDLFADYGLSGLDPERYLVETAGMKGLDVLRYFLDPSISPEKADKLTELKDILYRVMNSDAIVAVAGRRSRSALMPVSAADRSLFRT